MISLKQVEEWWDAAERTTPGPWVDRLDGWTVRGLNDEYVCQTGMFGAGNVEQQVDNQIFIAAAKQAVPAMANSLNKVYQAMLDELIKCQRGCGKTNPTCGTCTVLLTILDSHFSD